MRIFARSSWLVGGKTHCTKAARDKGHEREIDLTLEAIRRGDCSPIPFEELMDVSEAAIAIEEAIGSGEVVSLHAMPVPAVRRRRKNPDRVNHEVFHRCPDSKVIRSLEL